MKQQINIQWGTKWLCTGEQEDKLGNKTIGGTNFLELEE
jgi:hypothetical protein